MEDLYTTKQYSERVLKSIEIELAALSSWHLLSFIQSVIKPETFRYDDSYVFNSVKKSDDVLLVILMEPQHVLMPALYKT